MCMQCASSQVTSWAAAAEVPSAAALQSAPTQTVECSWRTDTPNTSHTTTPPQRWPWVGVSGHGVQTTEDQQCSLTTETHHKESYQQLTSHPWRDVPQSTEQAKSGKGSLSSSSEVTAGCFATDTTHCVHDPHKISVVMDTDPPDST